MSIELDALQRRVLVLERTLILVVACSVAVAFHMVLSARREVRAAAQPDTLTVKRLAIEAAGHCGREGDGARRDCGTFT